MLEKLTVIILHYGDVDVTRRCVESLFLQEESQLLDVCVVNNDPHPERALGLRRLCEQHTNIRLIESKYNIGYAAGNNLGLRSVEPKSARELVCILNNDMILEGRRSLSDFVYYMRCVPDCVCAQPRIRLLSGEVQGGYRRPNPLNDILLSVALPIWAISRLMSRKELDLASRPIEVFRVCGACFVIRESVFRDIGFFDERTFLEREEDILGEKLLKMGAKSYFLPVEGFRHEHKFTRSALSTAVKQSDHYYFVEVRGFSPALITIRALLVGVRTILVSRARQTAALMRKPINCSR